MAVVTVPNTACSYTAAACTPNTRGRWVVLSFIPSVGASGSAAFWAGSAIADGSPLLPVVCAAGTPFQSGVFMPLHDIMVASIVGGSAIVWWRQSANAS